MHVHGRINKVKLIKELQKENLINPPKWLPNNVLFGAITGSYAYGVTDNTSDVDIYGIVMPPLSDMFPHIDGEIVGFGNNQKRFQQYQQHHINHKNKEYDITFFNIVKFFQLAIENNPNIVDLLFIPQHCVLHATQPSNKIINKKELFLHKGLYSKFVGYASSQNAKMKSFSNKTNPKRKESIEKYGYDVKFAYHNIRLLTEAEQLLAENKIDFSKNSDMLKSIRRGEWSLHQIDTWTQSQLTHLQQLKVKSDLPDKPQYDTVKEILIEIIEDHYGKVSQKIGAHAPETETIINDLESIIQKLRGTN